jgi:hypothetical protein
MSAVVPKQKGSMEKSPASQYRIALQREHFCLAGSPHTEQPLLLLSFAISCAPRGLKKSHCSEIFTGDKTKILTQQEVETRG